MAPTFDQAVARYQAGDRVVAKAEAQGILAGAPKNADAFNLLAVTAQDEGLQAEAETFARKAVKAAPNNPLYLNTPEIFKAARERFSLPRPSQT